MHTLADRHAVIAAELRRLSRARRPGYAVVHVAADAKGAVEDAAVSRRRPLDSEAAEQRAVVQQLSGLDRRVAEKARKLVRFSLLLAAAALLTACGSPESKLRKQFASTQTGTIQLPAGRIDVSAEIRLADGAHDFEIVGASNTLLKATDEFKGRAIIVGEGARGLNCRGFAVDGNRVVLEAARYGSAR